MPRFVIDQLSVQPGVNFKMQSLSYLTLAFRPRSYSELARRAGMPRGVVRVTCKGLSEIGWMKIEGSTRMVRPQAAVTGHRRTNASSRGQVQHRGYPLQCDIPSQDDLPTS